MRGGRLDGGGIGVLLCVLSLDLLALLLAVEGDRMHVGQEWDGCWKF